MLQVFTLVLLAPAILRPVCASLSEQIAFSTGWDQKKAAPKSTYDQVIEQCEWRSSWQGPAALEGPLTDEQFPPSLSRIITYFTPAFWSNSRTTLLR